jgi:hypothetical protein
MEGKIGGNSGPEPLPRTVLPPLSIPDEPTVRPTEERWAMRAIVSALCLVALIATTGALVLSVMNRAVPQLLLALGSTAVGALISMLVIAVGKSARSKDRPSMKEGTG